MSDTKEVFVSYSRADKDKVFPLVKTLEKGVGTKFWIDLEGIESTAQFLNVIRQAIKDSQVVLFMLSDNSINGEWTQREVMFAKECGKRVVPVILDGGGLRDWTELYFANVNYVDAKNRHQIEKLSKEIAGWIKSETVTESTSRESSKSPKPHVAAITNKPLRLVVSPRNILLVIAALIVFFFITSIILSDVEEQDEKDVQKAEIEVTEESISGTPGVNVEVMPAKEDDASTRPDTAKGSHSRISIGQNIPREEGAITSINGHAYVDLGLSVKWATCNVGASSPEDYGDYYAWGETSPKSTYTEVNSKTYDRGSYNYDISGNVNLDAACANWGGTWRLPTKVEAQELKDKCTWMWTTRGGHNGYKVTGPNGKSIFLPAAGGRYRSSLWSAGYTYGYYWTSSLSEVGTGYRLHFHASRCYVSDFNRCWGFSVRPVSN